MKKVLALALTLMMGASLLSACSGGSTNSPTGQSPSETPSASAESSETPTSAPDSTTAQNTDSGNRTLIVGTVGTSEPYSQLDDKGNWTGVEAELWAEVEKRLGWTVEVKQVSDLASLFGELDTGRIDVAANCFAITEARLENYIASAPFYADAQVIVVQPDSEYMTLEDLKGLAIGVTAGQAAQNTVEKLAPDYNWEITTYEDTNAGLMDCSLGRVTAFAHTVTTIEKAKRVQNLDFRMLDEKLFGNNVGWWFADDEESAAVRDELNTVIAQMHEDGTLSQIVSKWFYEDLTQLISDEWLTATK